MEQTIIYKTQSKYSPYLLLENNGFYEKVTFGCLSPSYESSEDGICNFCFKWDSEKETKLIKTIKDRMAIIGVTPGDESKRISLSESGFPVYYGKTIEQFINGSLRSFILRKYCSMSFEELIDRIKNDIPSKSFITKCSKWNPQEFVLTVNKPVFRRATDNENERTFDFIDVEMTIRSTDANRKKVYANRIEIFKKAISKIENSQSFKKYGIPVNCLNMYGFILRHDGTIMVSFELKKEAE